MREAAPLGTHFSLKRTYARRFEEIQVTATAPFTPDHGVIIM